MRKVLTFLIISALLVSTIVIAAPLFKVKTANTVQKTQEIGRASCRERV